MLPNLIIIGAQKCGTTAMHDYLALHPQIAMSREKELTFFVAERNWTRGPDWYQRQFTVDRPVRGESSPSYTNYPRFQGVAQRMHALLPDARLIYIVRDPISRILAHYIHRYADGDEHRSIDQALHDFHHDRNDYVQRSRYAMQLAQFLDYYPLDRILVLAQEQLLAQRRPTLQRVFRFLHVDDVFSHPGFDTLKHPSSRKRRKNVLARTIKRLADTPLAHLLPTSTRMKLGHILYRPLSRAILPPALNPELRARIQDYLRPDVQQLRQLTSQSFPEWSL